MSNFTHIDDEGRVRMVDVTDKKATVRAAVAGGTVSMKPEILKMIGDQKVHKRRRPGNGQNCRHHGC